MKSIWKYLLAIAVVAIFVGYVIFSRNGNGTAAPDQNTTSTGSNDATNTTILPPGTGPSSSSTGGSSGSSGTGSGSGTSGTGTGTTGMYKDGSYTGPAEDAFYGTIQVEAVVSGGALTDVTFLQYPDAPGHTTDVSNMALPQLKQEAIAAQSANVNIVSGATQDSQAFQQSLAAALAMAKN